MIHLFPMKTFADASYAPGALQLFEGVDEASIAPLLAGCEVLSVPAGQQVALEVGRDVQGAGVDAGIHAGVHLGRGDQPGRLEIGRPEGLDDALGR